MNHLEQLYQEMILDHNRNPKNFRELENPTHRSHGINPLCGDDYHLYLKVSGDSIEDVSFQGSGCAISKSSASMLTAAVIGKNQDEVLSLKDHFLDLVTTDASPETKKSLGRLKVFEGVKQFPIRVKCATLIWRALEDALSTDPQTEHKVSTE